MGWRAGRDLGHVSGYGMMIRLTGMYEKKSAKTGLMYFTGRLNMGSRVLLMQNLRAGEGDPPWELFIANAENTLTRDQIAAWKAEHGNPAATVERDAGLEAALGAGPASRPARITDDAPMKRPKKRRGRPPKVKVGHDLGRGEDPDDGFPDWVGAG